MDTRLERGIEDSSRAARLLEHDPSLERKESLREPGAPDTQQSLFPENADSFIARIGEKTGKRLKQTAGFPEGIAA